MKTLASYQNSIVFQSDTPRLVAIDPHPFEERYLTLEKRCTRERALSMLERAGEGPDVVAATVDVDGMLELVANDYPRMIMMACLAECGREYWEGDCPHSFATCFEAESIGPEALDRLRHVLGGGDCGAPWWVDACFLGNCRYGWLLPGEVAALASSAAGISVDEIGPKLPEYEADDLRSAVRWFANLATVGPRYLIATEW